MVANFQNCAVSNRELHKREPATHTWPFECRAAIPACHVPPPPTLSQVLSCLLVSFREGAGCDFLQFLRRGPQKNGQHSATNGWVMLTRRVRHGTVRGALHTVKFQCLFFSWKTNGQRVAGHSNVNFHRKLQGVRGVPPNACRATCYGTGQLTRALCVSAFSFDRTGVLAPVRQPPRHRFGR